MDNLLHFVQTVNSYLSDYILVILLIGVGLWYSIKTNFVQVRCFGEGMKKVGLKRLKVLFYMNDVFRASTVKQERGIDYPFARNFSVGLQARF